MAWVYLDDHFPDHPKVQAAGDEAAWLYVTALCYSQRNKTLGRIPRGAVPKLVSHRNPGQLVDRLVEVAAEASPTGNGLWHPDGSFYRIHDYEGWNKTAVKVAEEAETRTNKARRAATSRWSKHSLSNAQAPPDPLKPDAQALPKHMLEHPGSSKNGCSSNAAEHPPRERDYTRAVQTPNPITPKSKPALPPEIVDDFKSSSSELPDDDDLTPEQQAWRDARRALVDREQPDVVKRLGKGVLNRRGFLAVAYRNALDKQADHAVEHLDQLNDQMAEAMDGNDLVVEYLTQARESARQRVEARDKLRVITERCHTCHDRPLLDIDDQGNAIWCPDCTTKAIST